MPEESSARDWTLFLQDMQRFCAKVSRYTEGLGQQQFLADKLITAKQIPPDVRLRHPWSRGGVLPGSVVFWPMPSSSLRWR